MKRWYAFLLTLAMVMTFTVPVMAADTSKLKEEPVLISAPAGTVEEEIAAKGGVPGELGVLLNGSYIQFSDARPEITDQRMMVPVRAALEAMGATVSYDKETGVTVDCKDTQLSFPVGSKAFDVKKGGETKTVMLDCQSYIKNGHMYMPIRILKEIDGYIVSWDNAYKTAVVLDTDAIASEMDKQFETFNKLMKVMMEKSQKNQKITSSFTGTCEVMNTVNGNQTYDFSGDLSGYMNGKSFQMDGSMDLSALCAIMEQYGLTAAASEQDKADLEMLQGFLKDMEFSACLTEDGGYYISMPLYTWLLEKINGNELGDHVWIELMDFGDMMNPEEFTMGEILCSSMEMYAELTPFHCYDSMNQTGNLVAAFFGDDCFQKKGFSYEWTMDLDRLISHLNLDEETQAMVKQVVKDLDFSMTIDVDGDYIMKGLLEAALDPINSALKLKFESKGSTRHDVSNCSIQVRDILNLDFKSETDMMKVKNMPEICLPEDAVVINFQSLMNTLN